MGVAMQSGESVGATLSPLSLSAESVAESLKAQRRERHQQKAQPCQKQVGCEPVPQIGHLVLDREQDVLELRLTGKVSCLALEISGKLVEHGARRHRAGWVPCTVPGRRCSLVT